MRCGRLAHSIRKSEFFMQDAEMKTPKSPEGDLKMQVLTALPYHDLVEPKCQSSL